MHSNNSYPTKSIKSICLTIKSHRNIYGQRIFDFLIWKDIDTGKQKLTVAKHIYWTSYLTANTGVGYCIIIRSKSAFHWLMAIFVSYFSISNQNVCIGKHVSFLVKVANIVNVLWHIGGIPYYKVPAYYDCCINSISFLFIFYELLKVKCVEFIREWMKYSSENFKSLLNFIPNGLLTFVEVLR